MIVIGLTRGKETVIDDADVDLSGFTWHAHESRGGFYAQKWGASGNIHLHRVILERKIGRALLKGERPDHVNGNTLDNRRENLRVSDISQNALNARAKTRERDGIKGVCKKRGRYYALLTIRGTEYKSGYFSTKEEAARAYDELAKQHCGEFARLNVELSRSRVQSQGHG